MAESSGFSSSSYKDPFFHCEGSILTTSSNPKHIPKVLPPNTSTSGVRASTDEWQDHKHSFHTRGLNDSPIK